MNNLTIDLDLISSDLTPGEFIVLNCIYTGNYKGFKTLSKTYEGYIPPLLKSLEKRMYIKIVGEEFEQLVCRDKTLTLFGGDNDISFKEFWDNYHTTCKIPKTDYQAALGYWNKLPKKERKLALENIKNYYNSLTDKRYCKKARTFLKDKNYFDEFTPTKTEHKTIAL